MEWRDALARSAAQSVVAIGTYQPSTKGLGALPPADRIMHQDTAAQVIRTRMSNPGNSFPAQKTTSHQTVNAIRGKIGTVQLFHDSAQPRRTNQASCRPAIPEFMRLRFCESFLRCVVRR